MPVLFKEAREQAKELDLKFAQTKTLVGPLHGVPFSVKVRVIISLFYFVFVLRHELQDQCKALVRLL